MFAILKGMSQTEKSRLVFGQSFTVIFFILLSILSLLYIDLDNVLPNTEFVATSSLSCPKWIEVNLPSLPALARHKTVIVETELGEALCVIGGDSEKVYCYPLGSTGMPDSAAGGELDDSLGEALRFHAATAVGNRAYVLGGNVGQGLPRENVYCVQRDTGSGTWTVKRAGVMRKKTMQHAAITVGSRIYVIGGYDDGWNYLPDVWSADAGTGCITLSRDDWREEKSLHTEDGNPHKVTGHAVVSVVLENGRKYIYVIGGMTANDSPTNTVLRAEVGNYGILSDWDDLGAVDSMPETWLLTAAVSGRFLYILGGTTSPTASTSSDKIYRAQIKDDGELIWEVPQDPDLHLHLPVPLHAHATTVSKHGRLYVVGGINEGVRQDEIYFTPLLYFKKLANPSGVVSYGDTINYTLKIADLCVRDLESVLITDTIPLDTRLLTVSGQPVTEPISWTRDSISVTVDGINAGSTITWDLGTLPITSSGQVSFAVQVVLIEGECLPGGAQPLAGNLAGRRAVFPDWFVTDRIETPETVANPSHRADAEMARASPDLKTQDGPSYRTSTMQPGPMLYQAYQRIGSSLAPVTSLGSRSVTTGTISPQCVPTILGVHPATVCNDVESEITIEGADFRRTLRVQLGDAELPGVTFVSPNTLTAVIPSGMAGGAYSLTVTNPGGGNRSDTLTHAITVVHAALAVTGVQPDLGTNIQETVITVTGENLLPTPTLALENAELTNETFLSSTAVTAVVPVGLDPGYYNLTITNPKPCTRSVTMRAAFTVTRGPFALTAVSPTEVCCDERTPITITGDNFPPEPIFVYMNDTPLQATSVTSSEIKAIIPGLMPTGVYSLTVLGDGPCDSPAEFLGVQAITPDIICWYSDTLADAIMVTSCEPVIITNRAYLCIGDVGCVPSDPVINTPYKVSLPFTTKSYTAP